MKVGFFKALTWITTIMDEVNKAYSDDQAISAEEVLNMFINISRRIDLPIDENTKKILNSTVEVLSETKNIVKDKKVTVEELFELSKTICDKLGYELDDEVIDLDDFNDIEDFLKTYVP